MLAHAAVKLNVPKRVYCMFRSTVVIGLSQPVAGSREENAGTALTFLVASAAGNCVDDYLFSSIVHREYVPVGPCSVY